MLRARDIAALLGVENTILSAPDDTIEQVRIDSRQIGRDDHSLFVALKGLRTDGHRFLQDAWRRGARNFLISEDYRTEELPDSNKFVARDVIEALQQIAKGHRSSFDIAVVGITGSNGKTWVKEWLYALLAGHFQVMKSPRSYNSQIGVPLSIMQLRPNHNLAIIEAGISRHGEMQALAEVIRPTIGVLTYLGDAHDAGFETRRQKLEEKCRLFETAGTIVYPGDYPEVADYIESTFKGKKLVSWGYRPQDDLRILEFHRGRKSRTIYEWNEQVHTVDIPFRDQASWYNAMICCAVLHLLGLEGELISGKMEDLPPVQMRLELHRLPGGGALINDTYSLDLASLQVGLDSLNEYSSGLRKALIITEIDQQNPDIYERLGEVLNRYPIDNLFAIGPEVRSMAHRLKPDIRSAFYNTFEEFVQERPWEELKGTAFLLKGARRFQLERLVQTMKSHSHSAALHIDLNAMLHNLKFFQKKLHLGTAVIAMVKAAAYGSGGAEVARFLEYHNVSMLGVAYADEGVELRTSGVEVPILVLNPDLDSIDPILNFDLEPEVYNLDFLQALNEACLARDATVNIHLKIDTGMHRLGFENADIEGLLQVLKGVENVRVRSVFSHLAAASDGSEEEFTRGQAMSLKATHERIAETLGYRPMCHILNSDGVIHYPEYQFDAVRLGIGLYGTGVSGAEKELIPVHTFAGRISQVREIASGESIGYDRAFRVKAPMRIATVNIGYADGLPRISGRNGFRLMIHGKLAPIVGNICMDMCMADVTQIPEAESGDEVLVFGKEYRIENLAKACSTIPYEILTGISYRIPRIFNFGW